MFADNPAPFRRALLNWYTKNARDLPWRRTSDPYAIWVSEIMLQQTTVKAVIPYFERWMIVLPTVRELARARQEKVLKLWEGLGYYSRARNLQKAAKLVLRDHDDLIPQTADALQHLPGIGPYTASAIASIAFGEKTAVLDGNVIRVLARLMDFPHDTTQSRSLKTLSEIANCLIAPRRAGDFNQAMMELGATVCTPRVPNCVCCPVKRFCLSHKNGTEELRPVRPRGKRLPHHSAAVGIVTDSKKRILIRKRAEEERWGGLWELIEQRIKRSSKPEKELLHEITALHLTPKRPPLALGRKKRLTSMFTEDLILFKIEIETPVTAKNHRWVSKKQAAFLPTGAVTRRILEEFVQ